MPITAADLQPGDLLLCYGWNLVGKAQGAAKALTRAVQASNPLTLPLRLAAGPLTWGSADCNHALVVGDPKAMREVDSDLVRIVVAGALRGPAQLDTRGDRVVLVYKDDAGEHKDDITEQCASLGRPTGLAYDKPKNRDHVVKVICTTERTVQNPRIAHSTGGGCVWTDARAYLGVHAGKVSVYRLRDARTRSLLAPRAGHVAITWATDVVEHGPNGASHYSKWKAFTSILGTSHYGSNAKARAAKYRAHRDTVGGPPSDKKWGISGNKTSKKEWFCSMFAIACYQAATEEDAEVARCLPLDAKHTSPMMLDGYVRRSGLWDLVGSLPG